MTPRLSVVVPTYERPALLRACIESFDDQVDAPDFEVVVIDDGSGDHTPAVLDAMAADRGWLHPLRQSANRGPAAARNAGLAAARGDLLLFVDDDVVASPTLLRTHADLHAAAGAGAETFAVLGRVDWHPSLEVTPFMRWIDTSGLQFAYDTWLVEGPVEVPAAAFYTANLSMPRRLVLDAGGFDERFPFPAYEDLELATRLTAAGLRMDYRPAALAYHLRAIDLATFVARMRKVGESAELMRTISPGFDIDDRALREQPRGLGRRTVAAAKAVLRPTSAHRDAHYWSLVAAAYDDGIRAGRARGGHG